MDQPLDRPARGPQCQTQLRCFQGNGKNQYWRSTVLLCGPTWISLASSIMLPITKSPFWEYMRPGRSPKKRLSMRITGPRIAKRATFQRVPRRSCVIDLAARLSRPIATEQPGWTSTTRRSGKSDIRRGEHPSMTLPLNGLSASHRRAETPLQRQGGYFERRTIRNRIRIHSEHSMHCFERNYFGVLAVLVRARVNFIVFSP